MRVIGTASQRRVDELELDALVGLCDAQTAALDRVRRVLDAHRAAAADQLTIRQMLSHELRTPLAVVIGALGTLVTTDLDAGAHRGLVDMAHRQALRLSEIVDDIIHLSSPSELHAPRVVLERIGLAEIVDEACAILPHELEQRVEIDVPRELIIATVPGWLRQIVVNLMADAACRGVVPVRVWAARRDDEVVIEVGGAVVEEPERPLIERAGVGLYVVRALARALGGTAQLAAADPADGPAEELQARVSLPQRRASDPRVVGLVPGPERHPPAGAPPGRTPDRPPGR